MICLFDLILYVPVKIFQSCWDGSSWVEPVLSRGTAYPFQYTMTKCRKPDHLKPVVKSKNVFTGPSGSFMPLI